MHEIYVPRAELDALAPMPVLFDALVFQDDKACVFVKRVTLNDPGVAQQRTSPSWPHHLPGELTIALTGQAAFVAIRRLGLVDSSWRGHGVRIIDARYSAPVLLGEEFYTRVEIDRARRLLGRLHIRFKYRMWKNGDNGAEVETYRSQQDAIFFPG